MLVLQPQPTKIVRVLYADSFVQILEALLHSMYSLAVCLVNVLTTLYTCSSALLFIAPGGPPNAIDISFDSPFNVSVSWAIPEAANGIITRYTLYVDYKNGSVVPINLDPSVNDFVITGLTPYQSIGVSLSASTSIGMGPNSTVVSGTTEQTRKSYTLTIDLQY